MKYGEKESMEELESRKQREKREERVVWRRGRELRIQ